MISVNILVSITLGIVQLQLPSGNETTLKKFCYFVIFVFFIYCLLRQLRYITFIFTSRIKIPFCLVLHIVFFRLELFFKLRTILFIAYAKQINLEYV